MIHLFKRGSKNSELGHLEIMVMEVVWTEGESSVRTVSEKLTRPLAYTTVMTTLDRLFKKGLLSRRKEDRAFFYLPRWSRNEWERKRADELVASFLRRPKPATDLLICCLVDAVGQQDAAFLDDLERRINLRRQQLRTQMGTEQK